MLGVNKILFAHMQILEFSETLFPGSTLPKDAPVTVECSLKLVLVKQKPFQMQVMANCRIYTASRSKSGGLQPSFGGASV